MNIDKDISEVKGQLFETMYCTAHKTVVIDLLQGTGIVQLQKPC